MTRIRYTDTTPRPITLPDAGRVYFERNTALASLTDADVEALKAEGWPGLVFETDVAPGSPGDASPARTRRARADG